MFNRLSGVVGAALALAGPSIPFERRGHDHTIYDSHRGNRGWGSLPVPGGGAKERARRRRQIEAGQLKEENGVGETRIIERDDGRRAEVVVPDDRGPIVWGMFGPIPQRLLDRARAENDAMLAAEGVF